MKLILTFILAVFFAGITCAEGTNIGSLRKVVKDIDCPKKDKDYKTRKKEILQELKAKKPDIASVYANLDNLRSRIAAANAAAARANTTTVTTSATNTNVNSTTPPTNNTNANTTADSTSTTDTLGRNTRETATVAVKPCDVEYDSIKIDSLNIKPYNWGNGIEVSSVMFKMQNEEEKTLETVKRYEALVMNKIYVLILKTTKTWKYSTNNIGRVQVIEQITGDLYEKKSGAIVQSRTSPGFKYGLPYTNSIVDVNIPCKCQDTLWEVNDDLNKYQYFKKPLAKNKKDYNNGLRYGSRPQRAILGFNFAPSFAYRSLYMNNADVINDDANAEFLKRKQTETFDLGFTASVAVGYAYKAHHIYAEGIFMRQGFKTTSDSLNWSTGQIVTGGATIYKAFSAGAGIGYSYRKFWYLNKAGFIVDAGLYFTKPLAKLSVTGVDYGRVLVGLKAGVGLSLKPSYLHEVRLMPVVYYNFTNSSRGAAFGTHFINAGLNLSWTFHLNKKLL